LAGVIIVLLMAVASYGSAILGNILMALVTFVGWQVVGLAMVALGYLLRATLDNTIHSIPFLSTEQKVQAIGADLEEEL
jgi:hypothetical protein